MTETVNRWHMPRGTSISEHEDGEFVLSTDYARLEQECERLRGLLLDAKTALDPFDDKLLEARIDAALAKSERPTNGA